MEINQKLFPGVYYDDAVSIIRSEDNVGQI